ncbi:MAG: 16S rRNA (guanine(527)-N(7))-methyltransferase RsmG [Acidobacteriaceae bacterium]
MASDSLNTSDISRLLEPYLTDSLEEAVLSQFRAYLDLLLRWNARTNLTAVRAPEEIVRMHFGECIFAAQHLPAGLESLLDFGSGAGFPGVPIQLCHPWLSVTLAESQSKKAAFLREVVRTLGLPTRVLGARVESLPPEQKFAAVTLRAVDNMPAALLAASTRILPQGWLILLTSAADAEGIQAGLTEFEWRPAISIPQSHQRILLMGQRRS